MDGGGGVGLMKSVLSLMRVGFDKCSLLQSNYQQSPAIQFTLTKIARKVIITLQYNNRPTSSLI